MSAIEFPLEGPAGDSFEDFDFSRRDTEKVSLIDCGPIYNVSVIEVTKALNERIIEKELDNQIQYTIDNAVRILDISKQARQEKIDFWSSRQMEMYIAAGVGCVSVVGSGALLAMGGVAFGLIGVVTSVGLASIGFYRASQASTQISQWSHSLPEAIAKERKDVFEQGFLQAMTNGSPKPYAEILNPYELQGLYYLYFHTFVNRLQSAVTNTDKVRLIEESIAKGPLSPEAINIAKLAEHHFYQLSRFLQDYTRLVRDVGRIKDAAHQRQKDVRQEIEGRIAKIETEKQEALVPAKQVLEAQKRRIENERREAIRNIPLNANPAEARRYIDQRYRDGIQEAEAQFNQAKAILSRPYDESIRREREALELFIRNIEGFMEDQLVPYFNPIARIQIDAFQAMANAW